jgi:dTDP-4-dehydrorhamnose reductase
MLELWAGIEPTVNRVGDTYLDQIAHSGHDRRLSDLDLFAELGIRTVRYPVLWERTHDWSWADERLERLRELEIRPIVGLAHHGSGPPQTSLLDPSFAHGLADYAHRVAERYPWVEHWTPVNEPNTTARFSCLYGMWYPHARDGRKYGRAMVNQCRATVLAMEAIRSVNPAAKLVQTEDLPKTHGTNFLRYQVDFENDRRWLSFDLLTGTISPDHRLWQWLELIGFPADDELPWFREHPCPPDILGVNHYLSGERFLDHRVDRYEDRVVGGNHVHRYADVVAARVLGAGPDGPARLLREVWERYRLPLAITEAHNGCTREEQLRWLAEVWDAAHALRADGVDLRAVTVWSFLGAFGWNHLLCGGDAYESGVYDLRAPAPRPTALAGMTKALARGAEFDHPVLDGPGWWKRPERLWYPPVGKVAVPRTRSQRQLLVTGATGTLGRAFGRLCAARGLAHRLTTRAELDLSDPGSIARVLEEPAPWAVVNAAGYVRVDDAEVEVDACMAANRDGAAALTEGCGARGIPLVTFSTDLVFDGAKDAPYVETDRVAPLNVYGRSKAEAEQLVLAARGDALVVRTSAFFGPWDDYNFVTLALRALTAGEPFAAAADAVVSPTYVPDVVEATLDLLIDGERGIWHLANAGAVSWAELARHAAEAAELDPAPVQPCRAADLGWIARRPAYSALGSEKSSIMPPLDDALARYTEALLVQNTPVPERAKGAQ